MEKCLVACAIAVVSVSPNLSAGEGWIAPQSAIDRKNPLEGNSAALAQGRRIYEDRCADCHGEKGKGDGPAATDLVPRPVDLTNPLMNEQPDGVLFWKISEGRKPMPAYKSKLTEEQRWQTIHYIRTLSIANRELHSQSVSR